MRLYFHILSKYEIKNCLTYILEPWQDVKNRYFCHFFPFNIYTTNSPISTKFSGKMHKDLGYRLASRFLLYTFCQKFTISSKSIDGCAAEGPMIREIVDDYNSCVSPLSDH